MNEADPRLTYHNHVQQIGSTASLAQCSCTQHRTAPFSSEYIYARGLLDRRGERNTASLMYVQPETGIPGKLQNKAMLCRGILSRFIDMDVVKQTQSID
jgi:hypothetical protein